MGGGHRSAIGGEDGRTRLEGGGVSEVMSIRGSHESASGTRVEDGKGRKRRGDYIRVAK